jgi:ribosomal protein L30E
VGKKLYFNAVNAKKHFIAVVIINSNIGKKDIKLNANLINLNLMNYKKRFSKLGKAIMRILAISSIQNVFWMPRY